MRLNYMDIANYYISIVKLSMTIVKYFIIDNRQPNDGVKITNLLF